MKKLLLVFLTCLVLPSFGNFKEMLGWRHIPYKFKNWTRVYVPEELKYEIKEHPALERRHPKYDLQGYDFNYKPPPKKYIKFSNFYIRVSDMKYVEKYTHKKTGEKRGDYTRATVQIKYDVSSDLPFTDNMNAEIRFNVPCLFLIDKSGFAELGCSIGYYGAGDLEGKTSGTVNTTQSVSSKSFKGIIRVEARKN